MNIASKLAALAFVATSAVAYGQSTVSISVLPSSPRYMEPVYARIAAISGSNVNIYGAQVTMSGNMLTVNYQLVVDIGNSSYDVMLGRFPTGTYTVQLGGGNVFGATTRQFTVGAPAMSAGSPGTVPAVNYTDLWWNPAESGWGMSVHQGPTNQLFAAWFVYDASGNPTWYTLQPGSWTQTNVYSVFSGPVYRTTGPYYGATFDPSQVKAIQVGSASLSFSDYGHGQFRYTIDGVAGVKNIEREPIE